MTHEVSGDTSERKGRLPKSLFEMVGEILDRTRRMETRVTGWLESQGFDTHAQRPLWCNDDGSVSIPSMDCSVKDIVGAVPPDYFADSASIVKVHHKSQYVMHFYKE